MDNRIRVRFAPSPTGYLHIGNARTALFNWLFARHNNGVFVLRIEDTDIERQVDKAEELILEDLRWLGLDWDEGPDKGGVYGPYRQSDRMGIYQEYARRLLREDKAYYCYCTPEELEDARQRMLAAGELPGYDGRCAHLSSQERHRFEAEGRRPSVRFRTGGAAVVVDDLIRGRVTFEGKMIGDFIILRSDGRPAYNFAAVVDDILMAITHVLRGEDHLSNTPRQILLYQALGATPPQFGHLSMILGPDRTRLSKRHGATSVISYREEGYLPEALVNYLALLGWSSPDEKEIISSQELIKNFGIDRISRSAAIFDPIKLNWMNGNYVREAEPGRITQLCVPYLERGGYINPDSPPDKEWLEKVVASVKTKISYLAEISEFAAIYFEDKIVLSEEAYPCLKEPEAMEVIRALEEALLEVKDQDVIDSYSLIKLVQKKSGQRGKKLYMPMRIALTGKTEGQELTDLLSLLGPQRCLQRLRQILEIKELWVK